MLFRSPVKYLERYPDRFRLLHLKDLRKGTPTGPLTGHAQDETSNTLGTGLLDFPAILRAATKASVKLYYIEDEGPEARQQVPLSLQYLKSLRF